MPIRDYTTLPHISEKLWGEYDNNSDAVPDFEQGVLERARDDYGAGRLSTSGRNRQVREELQQRPDVEDQRFKENLSAASPTYGTALTGLGMGAGAGYLLDHALHLPGKLWGSKAKAQPYASHVKNMIGGGLLGKGLGWMRALPLLFMAQHYGTQAAVNPEYQRGEKGYLGSLGSTLANAGESTRNSMAEANERYGTLGAMPLHALNVAMDPLGAGLAGLSKGKEMLFGKSSEYLMNKAAVLFNPARPNLNWKLGLNQAKNMGVPVLHSDSYNPLKYLLGKLSGPGFTYKVGPGRSMIGMNTQFNKGVSIPGRPGVKSFNQTLPGQKGETLAHELTEAPFAESFLPPQSIVTRVSPSDYKTISSMPVKNQPAALRKAQGGVGHYSPSVLLDEAHRAASGQMSPEGAQQMYDTRKATGEVAALRRAGVDYGKTLLPEGGSAYNKALNKFQTFKAGPGMLSVHPEAVNEGMKNYTARQSYSPAAGRTNPNSIFYSPPV